jgi:hypothetical protein
MSDHILIGTQMLSPAGYLNLSAGKVYHFLVRAGCVRLVLFEERAPVRVGKNQRIDHPPPEVILIEIDGKYFDDGIDHGDIVVKPFQDPLPPWCSEIPDAEHGTAQSGQNSKKTKTSHEERLTRTLAAYQPLLEDMAAIIKSTDPFKHINEFARSSQPQLNGKRLRAEIFAYILYSCNSSVIAYQTHRIGRWKRQGHPGKKPGIKSLGVGKLSQSKSTDEALLGEIRQAWSKWGKLGTSIKSIYRKTCAQIWRTTVVKDAFGVKYQIRTDGALPITYQQFRYRLNKLYGSKIIKETLSGHAFFREEMAPSLGKFTESICNVGERVDADGYWVDEVVIGPDGKNPLPALVVVRIVCCVSGMFLGIGFSLGGETAAAYRMALFCMAVKKSIFGRLLGLDIDDTSWPSVGLCDDVVTDRGAGGGKKGRALLPEGNPIIHSMPPTGYGQGKAIVESSNPRKNQVRDRPAYTVTSFGLIDVVRREVQNTISLNDARDMSGRLTPKMLEYLDRITPLDIFNKLSERGRSSLRPIAFDDAIRSFLTPVELTAKPDGVYHRYQRYKSDKLEKTGILQTVTASGNELKLPGFMLDMSTRYCFLDWKGELIELAAVLALREDEDQLYISLHQLNEVDRIIRKLKSDFRIHSDAALVEGIQDLSIKTGIAPENITVKKGVAKRRSKKGSSQAKLVKSVLIHAGGK